MSPYWVAAGLGALWGTLGYAALWENVPFAPSRGFVLSVHGTLALLPVRVVLGPIRAATGSGGPVRADGPGRSAQYGEPPGRC